MKRINGTKIIARKGSNYDYSISTKKVGKGKYEKGVKNIGPIGGATVTINIGKDKDKEIPPWAQYINQPLQPPAPPLVGNLAPVPNQLLLGDPPNEIEDLGFGFKSGLVNADTQTEFEESYDYSTLSEIGVDEEEKKLEEDLFVPKLSANRTKVKPSFFKANNNLFTAEDYKVFEDDFIENKVDTQQEEYKDNFTKEKYNYLRQKEKEDNNIIEKIQNKKFNDASNRLNQKLQKRKKDKEVKNIETPAKTFIQKNDFDPLQLSVKEKRDLFEKGNVTMFEEKKDTSYQTPLKSKQQISNERLSTPKTRANTKYGIPNSEEKLTLEEKLAIHLEEKEKKKKSKKKDHK